MFTRNRTAETVLTDTKHETTVQFKASGHRWHRNSVFGPGTRKPMSKDEKNIWTAQVKLRRVPEGLTIGDMAVAQALLEMLQPNGQLTATYRHIANKARVSRATVGRSLSRLEAAGLLRREAHITRNGNKTEQTANSYTLHVIPCESHAADEFLKSIYTKQKQRLNHKPQTQATRVTTTRKHEKGDTGGPRPSNLTDAEAIANRDRQIRLLMEA